MKFEHELRGLIADGVLVRLSTVVPEASCHRWAGNGSPGAHQAVPPGGRPALVGSR
jgi:hypothetical protein